MHRIDILVGHSWVWDLLYHSIDLSIWANGADKTSGSFYTCFPHCFPVAVCSIYILSIASLLSPNDAPSCVWSEILLQSAPLSARLSLFLVLGSSSFSSLYSVSLHLESHFHSSSHQPAALGCGSLRLFVPVTVHETGSGIFLYFELRQYMRPFSKGKVVRQQGWMNERSSLFHFHWILFIKRHRKIYPWNTFWLSVLLSVQTAPVLFSLLTCQTCFFLTCISELGLVQWDTGNKMYKRLLDPSL